MTAVTVFVRVAIKYFLSRNTGFTVFTLNGEESNLILGERPLNSIEIEIQAFIWNARFRNKTLENIDLWGRRNKKEGRG